MGPPGIPSLGGMFPITGLGAAAALCRQRAKLRGQLQGSLRAPWLSKEHWGIPPPNSPAQGGSLGEGIWWSTVRSRVQVAGPWCMCMHTCPTHPCPLCRGPWGQRAPESRAPSPSLGGLFSNCWDVNQVSELPASKRAGGGGWSRRLGTVPGWAPRWHRLLASTSCQADPCTHGSAHQAPAWIPAPAPRSCCPPGWPAQAGSAWHLLIAPPASHYHPCAWPCTLLGHPFMPPPQPPAACSSRPGSRVLLETEEPSAPSRLAPAPFPASAWPGQNFLLTPAICLTAATSPWPRDPPGEQEGATLAHSALTLPGWGRRPWCWRLPQEQCVPQAPCCRDWPAPRSAA